MMNNRIAIRKHSNWFSIVLLSIAAIIFVTAELLPIGVLHEISITYSSSTGTIGLIVTGYAWAVALSAVAATSIFRNFERRVLILIILSFFSLSNIIVSFAPNLLTLYIGRVFGAFSHGIFWSIVGPLAVRLAPDSAKAKATSLVFGGIAIATVAVVPVATYISQSIGWRSSFLSIGIISLFISFAIFFVMPSLNHYNSKNILPLKKIITRPYLRRTFPVTALALTGHFCAFTYIGPILENQIGISHSYLPLYLLIFGSFGLLGNIIASLIPDTKLVLMNRLTLLTMSFAIIGINYFSSIIVLSYFFVAVWGIGICLLTVLLQSLVLILAPDAGEQASSIHVAMFNTGIGTGAFIGGVIINTFTPEVTAVTGSLLLLIAFIILLPKFTLIH